jgi:hypothetical protein
MTNTKLTSIDVEQQDDGMYQVVATYSNGKSKAWVDFDTKAEAYECLTTVEFMASKVK